MQGANNIISLRLVQLMDNSPFLVTNAVPLIPMTSPLLKSNYLSVLMVTCSLRCCYRMSMNVVLPCFRMALILPTTCSRMCYYGWCQGYYVVVCDKLSIFNIIYTIMCMWCMWCVWCIMIVFECLVFVDKLMDSKSGHIMWIFMCIINSRSAIKI